MTAIVALAAWSLATGSASAITVTEGEALINQGKYDECITAAHEAIEKLSWLESWRHLKIRSEMATGRYADARATLEKALERFPASIRLRLLGRRVMQLNNSPADAKRMLDEIHALTDQQHWRFTDSSNRIALGQFYLLKGDDARHVLETYYDRVLKSRPSYAATYMAVGELALAKHDYALAAESFSKAIERAPDDPATHLGLAKAYAPSDPSAAAESLARALELNPKHAESHLMVADRLIDRERYADAREALDQVLDVNPSQPTAWTYRAVLAHLEGNPAAETECRKRALQPWATNPEVDHVLGRKLSQKYRFSEGAAHQRRALEFDPACTPAKIALAQDLLRLGEEAEGWRLAQEVYDADRYNVMAHNLVTLHQTLADFETITGDGLLLRMAPEEARIYGPSALELLEETKAVLSARYDVALSGPIVVEIFPEQKDFAVRTFGMPGGEGFLGVCFGRVITLNSPASQGRRPANWMAVLWHEFCHAVTLEKSKNRMPRWLSEGISVYEERQRNPAWGQSMNARYRQAILGGGLVPISRLSEAFLNPQSPEDLDFAYFESALAVEYLIENQGLDTLRQILADLGAGQSIREVMTQRVASPDKLDAAFARFAEDKAKALAPNADWEPPEIESDADLDALTAWSRANPTNLAGLRMLASRLVEEEKLKEAKKPLARLIELYPEDTGPANPYALLADVHRKLGEAAAERSVLEELAQRDAGRIDAYERLMVLSEEAHDWEASATAAERMLAVNPLLPVGHRGLARAAEALNTPQRAVHAYRALLEMDPVDPAGLHHRLALALVSTGDLPSARRQVLMALEEAPRFRAAHRTLLDIVERTGEKKP